MLLERDEGRSNNEQDSDTGVGKSTGTLSCVENADRRDPMTEAMARRPVLTHNKYVELIIDDDDVDDDDGIVDSVVEITDKCDDTGMNTNTTAARHKPNQRQRRRRREQCTTTAHASTTIDSRQLISITRPRTSSNCANINFYVAKGQACGRNQHIGKTTSTCQAPPWRRTEVVLWHPGPEHCRDIVQLQDEQSDI